MVAKTTTHSHSHTWQNVDELYIVSVLAQPDLLPENAKDCQTLHLKNI